MDLKSIYCIEDGSPETTFSLDENLPALPLPKLDDTLQRYYEALKPFGTAEELANSKKIIDDFRRGVGPKLQAELEERAKTDKNWVAKWWEDYAYFAYRMPLLPYCSMIQPLCISAVNAQETYEHSIKNLARTLRYNCNLWNLVRNEQLKPTKTPDGQHCSSALWKRFYSTVRIPGEMIDEVRCHFKTVREGVSPTHMAISGENRIFILETVNPDGTIISYQQFYQALHFIYSEIELGAKVPAIPLLTCDERTPWARNRQHLIDLSLNNKEIIKLIEESHTFLALDDREPHDYSETSQMAGIGHSRWADKSSVFVQFRNGRHACIGEHSCYDGTLSISFDMYLQMSFLENPEPDWTALATSPVHIKEYRFDVDAHILSEVARMEKVYESREHDVLVVWNEFGDFGKIFLKSAKIHPDAFMQMMFQLTYYKLHSSFPATYETALMRFYYNGRTETVRSCSTKSQEWVLSMFDPAASNWERFRKFKIAIENQNQLMKEARTGQGIDRHLFGLWCSAYESGLETHPLYTDPLYGKSGGGGNFTLSTSCLGYTLNAGYVAPMVPDGYGAFYSITDGELITIIAVYRKSPITSAVKFTKEMVKLMREVRDLIVLGTSSSKL